MLETYERSCTPIYNELPCVRRTDSHHENDVDVDISLEKIPALVFGISCERNDIHSFEHRSQIGASCECRGLHYLGEMRTIRLDDIVRPVCLEETTVVVEVAVICRDAIGAVQYCEEIGQQVDQHQQPGIGMRVERGALEGCEKIR